MRKYQPVFVVIEGEKYQLSQLQYQSMAYFQECRAIDSGVSVFEIKQKEVVSTAMWKAIVEIVQEVGEDWPKISKVKSNCAQDYIGAYLANRFSKMGAVELSNLYLSVHFLKMGRLKRCIAAYFACLVYISDSIGDYEKLLQKYKVQELSLSREKQYRLAYSFLND